MSKIKFLGTYMTKKALHTTFNSEIVLWATRPSQQNTAWAKQLQALGSALRDGNLEPSSSKGKSSEVDGLEIKSASLLEIAPLQGVKDQQAIKERVMHLDLYQQVIFVSQNAVHYAFEWIEQYWPQLPVGIEYLAVGEKTAKAVQDYGVDPINAGHAMNSEALLALTTLEQVSGQKILICRGKGGRPKLAEVLEQRGASVDYCELYERRLPKDAQNQMVQHLTYDSHENCLGSNKYRQHVIPVFSGETLKNLTAILPNDFNKECLHLILPAQRVADIALASGYVKVFVAQNATEKAMLAATHSALKAIRNTSIQ